MINPRNLNGEEGEITHTNRSKFIIIANLHPKNTNYYYKWHQNIRGKKLKVQRVKKREKNWTKWTIEVVLVHWIQSNMKKGV